MVSNTAVVLLSVGCLLTMPALALAQDDLMAKARLRFEPIPTAAPERIAGQLSREGGPPLSISHISAAAKPITSQTGETPDREMRTPPAPGSR